MVDTEHFESLPSQEPHRVRGKEKIKRLLRQFSGTVSNSDNPEAQKAAYREMRRLRKTDMHIGNDHGAKMIRRAVVLAKEPPRVTSRELQRANAQRKYVERGRYTTTGQTERGVEVIRPPRDAEDWIKPLEVPFK